ncbi:MULTISPECIES: hypothetical protein [unclassified Streptomyces]|uniref:hypothetical protein n=1 Tax=unclassified Streptomyces TaxID=2593676 RepID=UPI0035DCC241
MSDTRSICVRRARFARRATAVLAAGAALGTGLLTGTQASAADLLSGPYTCVNGYVWREAVPSDLVCVTPQIRSQTATENSLAASRRMPNGGPYGPDTCLAGYVWRETTPADHVCVPPASRDQARADNANAPWRLVDPGTTPRGGVSVITEYGYSTGAYLKATGRGMSPNGTVSFYAVGINTTGPFSLGQLTADAAGTIPGYQYVGFIGCRSGVTQPATVVVLDRKSGLVTTAGTTDAFRSCG